MDRAGQSGRQWTGLASQGGSGAGLASQGGSGQGWPVREAVGQGWPVTCPAGQVTGCGGCPAAGGSSLPPGTHLWGASLTSPGCTVSQEDLEGWRNGGLEDGGMED